MEPSHEGARALGFADRREAGRVLARLLARYAGRDDVLVLGLPRGGVPVAYEVARALEVSLGAFVVRKLGVPGHEELAMGAIASGGGVVLDMRVISALGIAEEDVRAVAAAELVELRRREERYRGPADPPSPKGRVAILVDDGLATGSSMRAAAQALRRLDPARIVVAVPVAADETCSALKEEVDEVVCALTPRPFHAVGLWYDDFRPTEDEEVRHLLQAAAQPDGAAR
jgi:predicted phosphoribosyltransferase